MIILELSHGTTLVESYSCRKRFEARHVGGLRIEVLKRIQRSITMFLVQFP